MKKKKKKKKYIYFIDIFVKCTFWQIGISKFVTKLYFF